MVILPDTSAWVDYLRNRSTPAVAALDAGVRQGIVTVCEPVWAELVQGARDDLEQDRIERMLGGIPPVVTEFADWENAATIGRLTRRNGTPIESFMDCLIAGIAVHHGATVLHSDDDYERIAAAFPLLEQTRG